MRTHFESQTIRCGSCSLRHATAAEVRACYAFAAQAEAERVSEPRHSDAGDLQGEMEQMAAEAHPWVQLPEDAKPLQDAKHKSWFDVMCINPDGTERAPWEDAPVEERHPNSATDKQVAFIERLNREKDVPVAGEDNDEAYLVERNMDVLGRKPVSKYEASKVIDWLMGLDAQVEVRHVAPTAEVPAGRYALRGQDEVLRFYQVDRPEKGQWVGHVFVSQLFGAPGDYQRKSIKHLKGEVLNSIVQDVAAASRLYGQESAVCGVCHSPLTNEESRAYGIGPVCRNKTGW